MELSRRYKIDRARRNTLQAAGLVLGAILAIDPLHRLASAAPGGNGNGNGDGGNGNNNRGGNCFARGTLIRTREGYRPIETLTADDALRFVLGASRRSRQWSVTP